MKKISKQEPFFKVSKVVATELGFEAAGLLAFIHEFAVQGKACFASREYIAKQLPFSESTAQRLINKLVAVGYVERVYRKNLRVLIPTSRGSKMDP